MVDGTELKARQRAMWSTGDYGEIAKTIESASSELIERLEISRGQDVLDVACGTGNSAIPAARAGASVTGLDLTAPLLEIAAGRATEAGVEIELIEGDAEALPFDSGSFDRVVSVFGVMFAPDQPQAAAELVRVSRTGARIGICAWTPEGVNGRLFGVLGSHLPPPPPGFTPPVLWGTEDRVRELFSAHGLEPHFERRSVVFEDESVEHWLSFHEGALGPVVMAKAALEPGGKWEAARADLASLYEEANENDDGSLRFEAEYLVTTLHVPE